MTKLIVSDLDNTLLNSNTQISSFTSEVLARCQEEGHFFALATARAKRATTDFKQSSPVAVNNSQKTTSPEVDEGEIVPDYRITNNGATIWSKDTLISSTNIPSDIVDKLMARFVKTPQVTNIMIEYGDTCMTTIDESLWVPAYEIIRTDFTSFEAFDTPKFSIECSDIKVIQRLTAGFPQVQLYTNHGVPWHQIVSTSVNKGVGIQLVAAHLNIPPEEIICFGDDMNDLPMMEFCGTSVAMSNALVPVKKKATHVCRSNDEDGVARWLEENLLS